MLRFTGFSIFAICLCCFVLEAQGTHPAGNASSVFLSYNEYNSHAVYDACALHGPGTFSFLFNTHRPNAFLAYQDDGTYSNFDLFLINGKIQARGNIDECSWEQLVIDGNFSDSRWHRVRLTREHSNLTLAVDECHSQTILCDISSSNQERWQALYIGNMPLPTTLNSLAKPSILWQASEYGFQGCIGHVTQSVPGEGPKPLALRYSGGTGQACESLCVFGGKCDNQTDDVTGKECKCPGYGIEELMCKYHKSPVNTSLTHAQTIKTSLSSEFNATKTFSTKVTPSLTSSSQSRVLQLSTATSSSNIVESSTRAQSASDHARAHVDNKVAAMAKKSGAFCLVAGSYVPLYLGLMIVLQNDLIIQ